MLIAENNRSLRRKAQLRHDRLYTRNRNNLNVGDTFNYAPHLETSSNLKATLTRHENHDIRNEEWYKGHTHNSEYPLSSRYLPDDEYTYEVEITVTRKFKSKTLEEVQGPLVTEQQPQEPILNTDDTKETWDIE